MSLVSDWNKKCGKVPPQHGTEEYYNALMNQADRIQEELDELKEAIRCEDNDEILDALVDIKVTADGANFLSRHDTVGAFMAVMDNNDLKFTRHFHEADAACAALNADEHHVVTGTNFILHTAIFEGVEYHSVHRENDDKIMKFPNHPKVNLKPFIFRG